MVNRINLILVMFRFFSKNRNWILLNFPALFMALGLIINKSLYHDFIIYSGYIAISLLAIVLALNPLIVIFKSNIFLKKINKHRRIIGVAVFTYASLHFLCYLVKKGGVINALSWLFHPILLPGFIAFIIFAILAITSNNLSIRILAITRWRKLHKLVYFGEFFVIVHLLLWFVFDDRIRVLYTLFAFVLLIIIQRIRYSIIKKR